MYIKHYFKSKKITLTNFHQLVVALTYNLNVIVAHNSPVIACKCDLDLKADLNEDPLGDHCMQV